MDDKIDRLKKRQGLKKKLEQQKGLSISADNDLVEMHLNSEINREQIYETEKSISLTETDYNKEEVEELLKSISNVYDKQRMNLLIEDCKSTVLDNIIKPFGIAKYVFAKSDKDGGNVTTVQNFEKGITANSIDKERYDEYEKSNILKLNREHYDNIEIQKKGKLKTVEFNREKKKEIYENMNSGEKIRDGYTGKELGEKKTGWNIKKYEAIHLEHIISVSEIDKDSKNHLFAKGENKEERLNYKVKLARDDNNLTLIEGGMNSSKNNKDLMEWANLKVSPKHAKETGNPNMTNAEYYGTDKELIEKKYKKSKDFIKKQQRNQQFKKQGTETLIASGHEGLKMGLQQAVGIVLKELTEGIFDEISDSLQNGFKGKNNIDKTFFAALKERLMRVGNNVLSKWKDLVKAFGEGFFSGFLSSFVTVAINIFVTTSKRVVRIIREGFFSLRKALKLLFFPPENMSYREAAHEATKLIIASLAITGGVLLEQYLDTLLKKSVPFADMVSTVVIGIVTGLTTSLLVFMLDKLDIFGVNQEKQHDFIVGELDKMTNNSFEDAEHILKGLEIRTL